MSTQATKRPGKTPVVTSFRIGSRTYERAYVDCGKPNCSRCQSPHGRAPSHGPYWYMCASREGKWRRVYIGKNLDTGRYIAPNGSVNWGLVDRRPTESSSIKANEVTSGTVEFPPAIVTASMQRRARLLAAECQTEDLDAEFVDELSPELAATGSTIVPTP